MSDTTTTFNSALKQFYSPDKINDLVYNDQPTFKMLRKEKRAYGEDTYRVPLIYGLGGATSTDLNKAQSGASATAIGVTQFLVPRTKTFALGYISDDLVSAADGDASSFVKASSKHVEHVILQLARDLGISMFRAGYGDRGKIDSTSSITTTVLTLSLKSDTFNFEVGNRVYVTSNRGQAPRDLGTSGNPLTITGIDRDAGTLTFGFNVNDATNGIPTIGLGDYIGIWGDFSSAGGGLTKPVGFEGFLPKTAPTSGDSFLGVNRSVDTQRLAGVRVDGSSLGVFEGIDVATAKVIQQGGKTSHILMNSSTYQNLTKEMESRYRIINDKDATVGFRTIGVDTPKGTAMIVPDINCPEDKLYCLKLDTWKFMSLFGDTLYQVGKDFGDYLEFFRNPTVDNWELRMKYVGGMVCEAPGHNAVVSLV